MSVLPLQRYGGARRESDRTAWPAPSANACVATGIRKHRARNVMRTRASHLSFFCLAVVLAACVPAQAQAQDWPSKPVTFITPAAAGNSHDVVTRLVADRLTQIWLQQSVVLKRPGAGGLIAAQAAAAVEKDGRSEERRGGKEGRTRGGP